MPYSKALKAVTTAFVLMIGLASIHAHAVIKMTSTPVVYAAETVTADAKGKATTPLVQLYATSTNFSVMGVTTIALPADTYHFRIDLESSAEGGDLVFGKAFANFTTTAAADFSIEQGNSNTELVGAGATDVTAAAGGAVGDNYVVISTATPLVPAGSQVRVALNQELNQQQVKVPGLRIRDGVGVDNNSYGIRVRVYRDYFDAIAANAAHIAPLEMEATIIYLKQALMVTVKDPLTATADVTTGFTRFKPTDDDKKGEMGKLATVSVTTMTKHDPDGAAGPMGELDVVSAATGTTVTQANVMKSATATFSGNFAVGTPMVGTAGGTLMGADGKPVEKTGEAGADGKKTYSATDKASAVSVAIPVTTTAAFMLNVAGNKDRIPEAKYTAKVSVTLVNDKADAASHQDAGPLDAGEIVRDGTTVNIGYVTVSGKYNQRLILVNHGIIDAEFSIHSLVVEDGQTGTLMAPSGLTMEGDAVMGTIMAGQSVVLRLRDLASITGDGSPRGALTIDMSASSADASVATTQVNLSDGSADTVSYH